MSDLDEPVVFLKSISSSTHEYLLVVTQASCILYLIEDSVVTQQTSYVINARKKPIDNT